MASLSRVSLSLACFATFAAGCASSKASRPDHTAPTHGTVPPATGTTVTDEDLDRSGQDAIERALESRVPGLSIGHSADGGLLIRVRGSNSISGSGEPLYIIDGMEVQPTPGGGLQGINPKDIASIQVLKDAASLSYYGLRAANGVIVIKTKHAN